MPVALVKPALASPAAPILKIETRQKMQNSLVSFRFMALVDVGDIEAGREYKPAPFHHELSDLLLRNTEHVVIEMFRESGKSSYVLKAFPLYCCAYPRKDRSYILLIKSNETLAREKLKEIRNEYKSNPLLRHNLARIVDDSAKIFSVDVYNEHGEIINVRIEAYGKGSPVRGLSHKERRPQIVLLDDVQDREDARSESISRGDWDWFLSDIVFLGRNSRIFFIANNLGDKCIAEKIFKYAGELEAIKFKPIRVPVMVDDAPSWPDRDTLESIIRERNDYSKVGKASIWYSEKMCVSVADEARIFDEKDYRAYSREQRDKVLQNPSRLTCCMDVASSIKDTSCYRAITVVGQDEDNRWLVLDVRYGRWDTIQMLDEIFNVVKEYKLRSIGIETGQIYQILEPIIRERQLKHNTFFGLDELEHQAIGSKLERIKMLQPRFKAGAVLFPEYYVPWLNELKIELAGVTIDAINSEFVDCVDSLAMHNQVSKFIKKKEPTAEELREKYREALRGGPARAELAKLEDKLHINYEQMVEAMAEE
jgi:phage terminase large subunit-like protein